MTASKLILYGVLAVAALWAVKRFGLLSFMSPVPQTRTSATTAGKQNVVPKDDFQTAADDIASIMSSANGLFGTAQTSPKSL